MNAQKKAQEPHLALRTKQSYQPLKNSNGN